MTYEGFLRGAALFAIMLGVGAPAYFSWFWRWYDAWRSRRALTYALITLTIVGVAVPVGLWRDALLAPRVAMPAPVQALGWLTIAVWSGIGTLADRQLGLHVRSFGPHFEPRGRLVLCTTGAYGLVRHPIYAAGLFSGLGLFLVTGYLAVLAASAVFGLGAWWFTRREEERTIALLEDPGEYQRYRERVPALIPWPRRVTRPPAAPAPPPR